MILKLKWVNTTKNFVNYETENTDFRYPFQTVLKLWIPKQEIQTNEPGIFPTNIEVRIMDDSGSTEIVESHPETGIPWD